MGELTRFDVDCLVAIANTPMGRGLDIIEWLENNGYDEVYHGRTYPRLDSLAEKGLIVKHAQHQDKRSNAYEITTGGIKYLEAREQTIQNGLEKAYATQ